MDSVVLLSFSVACSYESLNNLVFVFCGKSSSSFVPLICFAFSVNGQNRPACIKSSDQHKQWRITSDVHYISQHKDCITLHYVTLYYITLHYITLHYITLHYITLHCLTLSFGHGDPPITTLPHTTSEHNS